MTQLYAEALALGADAVIGLNIEVEHHTITWTQQRQRGSG
jgi:uncharacterized protein YbjQ (UPF0145 family)